MFRTESEGTGCKTQLGVIVAEIERVILASRRFALGTVIMALVNSAPDVPKQIIEARVAS
jgi:hypothetical protein